MKFRVVKYKVMQRKHAHSLLCAELAAAAWEGGLTVKSLEAPWSAVVKAPLSVGVYWKMNRVEKKTITAVLYKPAVHLPPNMGRKKRYKRRRQEWPSTWPGSCITVTKFLQTFLQGEGCQ